MKTENFLKTVVDILDKKKAKNIKIIKIDKLTTLCDYFVVVDSDNVRHVKSLVDEVEARIFIQHELYMMVLEKLIELGDIPSGTVQGFEYHFIYEDKDENKTYKRQPDVNLRHYFLNEILNSFSDQVSAAPKENCKFCSYKDICSGF